MATAAPSLLEIPAPPTRPPLTDLENDIYRWICYHVRKGEAPSVWEVAQYFGLVRSHAASKVNTLKKRGLLLYGPGIRVRRPMHY